MCCMCEASSCMNTSAVFRARVEPQTREEAEGPILVPIPNALTKETLEKSRAGLEVETFDSLEEMFESWGPGGRPGEA